MALNAKQKEFVRQYLLSRSATEAALKAGYSEKAAGQIGHKLLKNAEISAAIEKTEEKLQKKFEVELDEIIEALYRIAFFNPMDVLEVKNGRLTYKKKIDPKLIAGANFTIYPEYQTKEDKKAGIAPVKLSLMSGDRRGALETLGKHLGLGKGQDAGQGANSGDRKAVMERLREIFAKRKDGGGTPGSSDL